MTKQLKWRLGKLPTPDEVLKLVKDKLITKEEARDILFKEDTELENSTEDLKQEIKFLKELIEKLSNRSQIIETIRYIEKPYTNWQWYKPYEVWCGNNGIVYTDGQTYLSTSNSANMVNSDVNVSFSAIS